MTSIENKREEGTEQERTLMRQKAMMAVSFGALCVGVKLLKALNPLPSGGLEEKEYKEYKEKGFIGIAVDRTKAAYKKLSELEDAKLLSVGKEGNLDLDFDNANWDKILGEQGADK